MIVSKFDLLIAAICVTAIAFLLFYPPALVLSRKNNDSNSLPETVVNTDNSRILDSQPYAEINQPKSLRDSTDVAEPSLQKPEAVRVSESAEKRDKAIAETLSVISLITELKLKRVDEISLSPEHWNTIKAQYDGLNENVRAAEERFEAEAQKIFRERLAGVSGKDYEEQELKKRSDGSAEILELTKFPEEVIVEEIGGTPDGSKIIRKFVRIRPGENSRLDEAQTALRQEERFRVKALTELIHSFNLTR